MYLDECLLELRAWELKHGECVFFAMSATFHNRGPVTTSRLVTAFIAWGTLLLAAQTARAQVPCQDFDPQCATDGVCQLDGTCKGTPKPDNTPCDDGNDCTVNDTCRGGSCISGSNAADLTPCTTSGLGLCATNTVCLSVPLPDIPSFCAPLNPSDVVACPSSGNKCQPNRCDPGTGECKLFTIPCNGDPCSTGQCDPSTGSCVAGNEGAPCDDGNVCTNDDQCHSGKCVGIAGATPPTATPGSPTPTPSATMVPTPTPCVGDCNGDGQVTVDEIVTLVDLALNGGTTGCPAGDANGDGQITVDEIVLALISALNGC